MLSVWVMKEALVKAGALAIEDFAMVAPASMSSFELQPVDYPGFAAALTIKRAPRTAG
jgi:hypothetical protein